MRFLLGILVGIVVAIVGIAVVGYFTVTGGLIPAAMDAPLLPGEKWAAKHDLKAVLGREGTEKSPLPYSNDNLIAGAKIYAANCGGCHGTPGDPSPAFGKGFSPEPTFFLKDSVSDDPEGWTYWKVKHGIKWTGMPSFNGMLDDKQIWQVTMFLKQQDKMPPEVQEYWKTVK